MNVFLMFRTRALQLPEKLTDVDTALIQDLGLDVLFDTMANGTEYILNVARSVLLSTADSNVDIVCYRQAVLRDCLAKPAWIRALYDIAVEAIRVDKQSYRRVFTSQPGSLLRESAEVLQGFVVLLRRLRDTAGQQAEVVQSEGLRAFVSRLQLDLDEGYLYSIEQHLQALKFRDGILMCAVLDARGKSTDFVLCKSIARTERWWQRWFGPRDTEYVWRVHPRDESGLRALSELRDRGIDLAANVVAHSTDHILDFFKQLQAELGFYLGCINLKQRLDAFGAVTSFPEVAAPTERRLAFTQLYDPGLSLRMACPVVGNDLDADGKDAIIVTGANRGGKSTFLRSLGIAQLMMQAGMFVAAKRFSGTLCTRLFTHYRREEDTTLESGKLDEELARMRRIVDQITPDSLLLCNESFAATNEREGSEIARQIVYALLEARVRVFFVTHLYGFAHGFFADPLRQGVFLQAERQADDRRTFKMLAGEPLETSFGKDLYYQIFSPDQLAQPHDQTTAEAP